MCGIAGVHIKEPGYFSEAQIEKLVNSLLVSLEHRGPDASGFVVAGVGGKQVQMSKEPLTASAYIWARPNVQIEEPRTILVHTRFATQGAPENNVNNHPLVHGTTFAVHNGHINNDDTLFASESLDRHGEVDSEIIPALINHRGLEHAIECIEKLDGGFAIGVIDPINYPDELFLAKGRSSPFYFFENRSFLIFASTVEAIKEAWGAVLGTPPSTAKFYYLKEGQALWQRAGEVSELETFEVLIPVYKPHSYTSYSSTGYCDAPGTSGYRTPSGIATGAHCTCGHTRFWHNGSDYDGACLGRKSDEICFCMSFEAEEIPETLTQCDECLDYYNRDNVYYIGYGHYYMCATCLGDDGTVYPPRPEPQLQLVRGSDADDTEKEDAWVDDSNLDWEALSDAENRHRYLMYKVAEGAPHGEEFCEWLLFKAPIEFLEQQSWAAELREELEEKYCSVDDELRAWEKEVGVEMYLDNESVQIEVPA